jgi:hypothetical protein
MKFMRGRTRKDRVINTYIRGELSMEETQNKIERSRLRWFGHVKSGRRSRGRPST